MICLKLAFLDFETLGADIDVSEYSKFGEVEVHSRLTREEVKEFGKDKDVIIVNKVPLDRECLDAMENLKLVCITATGYNNIDLAYAKSRGIAVCNVAGYSTESVTQHTFALLLSMLNHIQALDAYVKSGEYTKSGSMTRLDLPIRQISNMNWGILGLGEIGKAVAKVADSFGAKVQYCSPKEEDVQYNRLELDELLKDSDVISIHCPLTAETENMIDIEKLKIMKRDSIIINVARGNIINEADLKEAIEKNYIYGACLDVYENEPIKEGSPLQDIDSGRIIMTPHTAWAGVDARKKLVNEVLLNIESFLAGEKRNRL